VAFILVPRERVSANLGRALVRLTACRGRRDMMIVRSDRRDVSQAFAAWNEPQSRWKAIPADGTNCLEWRTAM
jgi:hypothetical protein